MEDPYIYINNNSLSKELCDDIIEIYENNDKNYKSTTIGGLNTDILVGSACECSDISNKKWPEIERCLFNELLYNLREYMKQINSDKYIHSSSLYFDNFRIQKYEKNEMGKYNYHMDELIQNQSARKITFIWYLNDVYEGGETSFYNKKVKPTVGKLLIFPSTWTYPHSSISVRSNSKYIIVGWIFRPV